MKRHVNIPVFIPHLGCPNGCVFCNQRKISGKAQFDMDAAERELRMAVETVDGEACEAEIAFFGGSFTGIDRADMLRLLETANAYIDAGKIQSVRISTRPDYIDDDILDILAKYRVTDIELGIQSLDDRVLAASKRGHTADQARRACRLIKARGFRLVGQMMIGLPASDLAAEMMTARELAWLGCDAARIYPTVVFYETELCEMMRAQSYAPLTMEDAIVRSAAVLEIFIRANIPVIRLGLCAAEQLCEPETVAGGAYHSAFGELVYGELYYNRMREYIESRGLRDSLKDRTLIVKVPAGEVSKASGQNRRNKLRLQNEYNVKNVKILENLSEICYNIQMEIV